MLDIVLCTAEAAVNWRAPALASVGASGEMKRSAEEGSI